MSEVFVYACPAMADWQVAYVTTGLAIHRRINPAVPEVRTAARSAEPLTTLGGLQVTPDLALADVEPRDVAMLVLPGGDGWGGDHREVLDLAADLLDRGVPVAGICAATVAMADVGLLDDVAHASNSAARLQQTGYAGEGGYVDAPAVRDGDVITARGTAPVAFAYEVFTRLETLPREHLDQWRRHMSDRGPRA